MMEKIDSHIKRLLEIRDSEYVINHLELRASICTVIEKAYWLENLILAKKTSKETIENQFFTSNSAVNRHFRDWGLDELADIYNELRILARGYIEGVD